MAIDIETYHSLANKLQAQKVTLVAVSKTKPVADIQQLYELGQRDFGENYVQELTEKQPQLPADVRWHFIGHLQSNKVKYIAPFVHLIHGIDSYKLLKEVDKQARKINRVMDVLLQVHIAQEETKFGLDENELAALMEQCKKENLKQVRIRGLMGMASFTTHKEQVQKEFGYLKALFDQYANVQCGNIHFQILSMGMSGDYAIAIEEGSNMVRIGSLIFGSR